MSEVSMFLSQEEIRELTGYQKSAGQRQWLLRHGWQFEVSRIGRPIVGRDYAKQKTGFVSPVSDPPKREPAMNLSAIQRKVKEKPPSPPIDSASAMIARAIRERKAPSRK